MPAPPTNPHVQPGQAAPHQTPGTSGPSIGPLLNRQKAWVYDVCASIYGGPTDPSSGTHGYHGDSLPGKMAFAELGMDSTLGHLPYGQKLIIVYKGKRVNAVKLDIGAGGAGCGGKPRAIDLWYQTAGAIGFNAGLDVVTIMKPDGSPMNIPGVTGKQALVTPGSSTPAGIASAVGGVVNSVGDGLAAIGKIFGFLFSRQFLYIAAGIPIVLIALAMIFKAQTGSSPIPKHIPIPV